MSFFGELKRRNVFRVAAAYIVVGWLLLQVADTLLPALHLPEWIVSAIALVLILGLIPVVLFSWAYELTPEGLKKDSEVDKSASDTSQTAKKLDVITIVAIVGIAALIGWQQFNPPAGQDTATQSTVAPGGETQFDEASGQSEIRPSIQKSIAVLPFADMSQTGDQEYFADGISEEILNVLVRIPKLKVAGRTSSFSFKGKNQNLREIGEALNVNHILEGSVRRSGAKLRITAQLIRSDDGFHLWSETYDREVADIFDIQDEIAKEVADQLAITLGLQIKTKPTDRTGDFLVYENYLKGRQLYLQRGKDNLDQALLLLNEATIKDPNFAPAWTTIAQIYNVYKAYATDEESLAKHKQWRAIGTSAAQRALSLNPDSGEAHAMRGSFFFDEREFMKGHEYFDRALKLSPDNPTVLDSIAQELQGVGYYMQAQKLSEKAIALDPLVAIYRNTQGVILRKLGDKNEAVNSFEKSIELDPKLFHPYSKLFSLYSNPDDVDKIAALVRRASENGALPADALEKVQPSLDIINNRSLLADKTALRQLARDSENAGIREFIATYLADAELAISLTLQVSWSQEYRRSLGLFGNLLAAGVMKDPRWKARVHKDGVFALWKSRGFPAQCKAVGDDDFECVAPSSDKS